MNICRNSFFKRISTFTTRTTLPYRCFSSGIYNQDNLTQNTYEFDGGYCKDRKKTHALDRFNDQVCIVTGAAGNFGRSCAERLVSEGARVALFDIVDCKHVTRDLFQKYPNCKAWAYQVDVTNEKSVKEAVDDVYSQFKRIDCLFNNAGYQGDFTQMQNYNVSDFRKTLDINVTGVFIVLQTVANAMISQNPQGGSIVNTASMAAHGAPPNMIAYGSSKAAVLHMTRIACIDLAPYNIRVNSVSPAFIGPGFMWTRQIELQAAVGSQYYDKDPSVVAQQMINATPMRRYGSLDEVIGPVTFLLSDDASYLTGVDIQVTGGMV